MVGTPEEKRQLRRHNYRWEINIKMEVEDSLWIEFMWFKIRTGRGAMGTR
jgi:hypothetical protein